MKTQFTLLVMLAILEVSPGRAQTVNTGLVQVQPGTIFATVGAFDNKPSGTFVNDGEVFVYNHFNNDGSVNFTTGLQGYTRFLGNVVQQLSGSNPSYFYDALFDNPSSNTASFEVSGEISIDNEADFNKGILNDDDFGGLVIFQNNANHINTSDLSHVDGPVRKDGNTAFEYPIGDGGYYRFAGISAPDQASDMFTAKYFYLNPDPLYPLANKASALITFIDDQEYWSITPSNPGSPVLITLSWDEYTTTPSQILPGTYQTIHIVRWDPAQNMWIDEGGVVDEFNKTVTTPVKMSSYGIFTLATYNIAPEVAVSQGFTPNSDGYNDVLKIDGLEMYPNSKMTIFNRWGVLVYESNNYQNDWDGRSQSSLNVGGDQLPEGTYYYLLELGGDASSANYGKIYKGYFYLKRQ